MHRNHRRSYFYILIISIFLIKKKTGMAGLKNSSMKRNKNFTITSSLSRDQVHDLCEHFPSTCSIPALARAHKPCYDTKMRIHCAKKGHLIASFPLLGQIKPDLSIEKMYRQLFCKSSHIFLQNAGRESQ